LAIYFCKSRVISATETQSAILHSQNRHVAEYFLVKNIAICPGGALLKPGGPGLEPGLTNEVALALPQELKPVNDILSRVTRVNDII